MGKINTHPADELLASHSAASLPLSQALCIASHLENCPACRQKSQRLIGVGSELMQQLKPSTPSSELKLRMMNQLDSLTDETAVAPSLIDPRIPHCLRQFVQTSYDKLPWNRVSPDIHNYELCRDNGAKVELLRIRAGGSPTTHTHMGDEYTVILEGSFSDETGLYHKGDFLLRDARHKHTPVASQDRECICLAVTEGPIQFTGFFSRLLNPFVRRSYSY